MGTNRFFKPFIGENYETGLSGKKVFVIGDSFYCAHREDCKYSQECTDMVKKDSSRFDGKCPDAEYSVNGKKLSDASAVELGQMYPSYRRFGEFLSGYVAETDSVSVWDYVAFTNYVQFFVPSATSHSRDAVSERDFEAFKETVMELKPDVVFVWGTIAGEAIRRGRKEVYDYDTPEFHAKEGYICHLRLDGLDKDVVIINTYHPCNMYGQWSSSLPQLKKYTDEVIETR